MPLAPTATVLLLGLVGLRGVPADTVLDVGVVVPVGPEGAAPVVEPHLAVDPDDPRRMVVAAMTFPRRGPRPLIRTWWSGDGGETWSVGALDPGTAGGADPWLAWGPGGRVHLVHLPDRHHVSGDGGRTWEEAPALPASGRPYDYLRMAVDTTPGAHRGRLWLWASSAETRPDGRPVGPVRLLRSDPDGLRFEPWWDVLPGDLNYQTGGLAVLPGGRIVAGFHEIDRRGAFLASPRLWVLTGGPGDPDPGLPALVREGFRADSPDMAAGPAAVYLSWTGMDGDTGRVSVARSVDGGRTWAEPVHLDRIPPDVYFPHHGMPAVNASGTVVVTWQRPRPDLGERCSRLHASVSLDGGRSFGPPTPVAPEGACATAPGNDVPVSEEPEAVSVGRRFGDGGDYHGLVALPDGSFRVVWADAPSGVYRLYTATLRVRTRADAPGPDARGPGRR